jgi:predicted nuclease of predicted toxin-antitoxin system
VTDFIADENFPLPSVRRLRQAGHDVVAVITETPGSTDEEVLAWAARDRRIVLTFDRDFGELIFRKKAPSPAGIVYFRFEPMTPEEPVEFLLRLFAIEGLSLEKHFTVVERRQVRQRALP